MFLELNVTESSTVTWDQSLIKSVPEVPCHTGDTGVVLSRRTIKFLNLDLKSFLIVSHHVAFLHKTDPREAF